MYDECAIDFCYGFADAQEVFRIRRLVYNLLESKSSTLNLDRALIIVDEINSRGPLGCHAVLGGIYERLYRRKGLYLALELLEFCVRNCGLDFAVFLRRPFLKAMTRLLKLKSLTEQTLVGQVNSTVKLLIKASKNHVTGRESVVKNNKHALDSADVILVRCQRKVLYLFQLWADAFMMQEDRVPDIFEAYRELRRKGYPFPPRDVHQRYLIKNAENSPAFISGMKLSSQSSSNQIYHQRCRTHDIGSTEHKITSSPSSFSSSDLIKDLESLSLRNNKKKYQNVASESLKADSTVEVNLLDNPNDVDPENACKEQPSKKIMEPNALLLKNNSKHDTQMNRNNSHFMMKTVPQNEKCRNSLTMILIENISTPENLSQQQLNSTIPCLPPPPAPFHLLSNETLQSKKTISTDKDILTAVASTSSLPQQEKTVPDAQQSTPKNLIADYLPQSTKKCVFEDLLTL